MDIIHSRSARFPAIMPVERVDIAMAINFQALIPSAAVLALLAI